MSVKKVTTKTGQTKWEVYIYTNGRGAKRLRRRFTKRSDAESFLIEYRSRKNELEKQAAGTIDFEETTFKKEAEHWLNIQGLIFSPGHLKRVKGILDELLPRLGHLSPLRLHAGTLTTLQSEMIGSGLKPATVNRKLEVITSILNFSAEKRRIPSNPSVGFKKLREVRDETKFWNQENAQSFLSFANTKYPYRSSKRWVYVVYLLAINSGVRAGEVWGLQPKDIVQDGEVLLIQRQFDRIKKSFRPTKGKSNRRVPCNSRLLSELQSLIRDEKIDKDAVIFRNQKGMPICHDNFAKRAFNQDIEEWGGPSIRFHDLRHTAATLMISSGLDLKTVQSICGHEEIRTTMNYAHLLAEKIREVARTFSICPTEEPSKKRSTFLRVIK